MRNPSRKVDVPSVVADLENDAGWTEAVAGCDYVLHVASPFPHTMPTDENELIVPAREGAALRVLRAARNGGVKRVVLTSSFAAIGYGHKEQRAAFDETNWSNVKAPGVTAYAKSKFFAELAAAWGFRRPKEGGSPGVVRHQSRRRVRPAARTRSGDVDPHGEAHDGRRHPRRPGNSTSASSTCRDHRRPATFGP